MNLIIPLIRIYKELSKEVKIYILLTINIFKEKTELLLKKCSKLMAR